MSGVWVFKNGVVRLVENPATEPVDGRQSSSGRRKVLVHTPTNEVITSYASLERKLSGLGWERYYHDPDLLQFHKQSSIHLISLPKDFTRFKSMHMFSIMAPTMDGGIELKVTKPIILNGSRSGISNLRTNDRSYFEVPLPLIKPLIDQ